jgi:hypothetical protein
MNFFAKIDMVFPAIWNSAGACSSLCAPEGFVIGPVTSSFLAAVVCVGGIAWLASRRRRSARH